MDLSKIIIDPKHRRRNKIGLNEDSFYYLCFACSFKAYSQNNTELLNRLHEKVLEKEDYFQDQLFYQLYTANWNWYTKQGDRGEAVFLDLAQGLIRKMKCSRQMLDIYRNIARGFLSGDRAGAWWCGISAAGWKTGVQLGGNRNGRQHSKGSGNPRSESAAELVENGGCRGRKAGRITKRNFVNSTRLRLITQLIKTLWNKRFFVYNRDSRRKLCLRKSWKSLASTGVEKVWQSQKRLPFSFEKPEKTKNQVWE